MALGRAIVRQPQVFLFDEPLSNLDAKLRVQMRREIAALRRRLGTTTIYVTHDQVEAMTLGDRIVVMKDGHVQQVDTPLGIYRAPANTFVATFVGSPPMNLIRGRVSQSTFAADESTLRLPAARAGLPPQVLLGIRPEALLLRPAGQGDFAGRVSEIEPLGGETMLTIDAGGVMLTARVDGSTTVRRDEPVGLTVAPEAMHWFAGDTEQRLT